MSQPVEKQAEDAGSPTPETLRTYLQSLAARLGRTPTVIDIHDDADTPFRPEQYVDVFGDWDEALDAAGLDPSESSKQIPDHELLGELHRLYEEKESPPTREDMVERGRYSDTVYQNRFGSWNDALQEAMLDTNDLGDDDLLLELERVARELGHVPTADEMRDHGEHRPVTYHRRFGSWRQALDAVDFSLDE